MNARDLAYYRRLRADGWRARYALDAVRDRYWVAKNVATDRTESADTYRVLFECEVDYDYEPDGDYDMDAERDAIARGEYTPVVLVAYRPRVVLGEYGAYVDGWDKHPVGAIGGVLLTDPWEWEDDPYAVEIVRNVAAMAGVR